MENNKENKKESMVSSFMVPTYQLPADKQILVDKLDITFRKYQILEKKGDTEYARNQLKLLREGFYYLFSEYPRETELYVQEAAKVVSESSAFMLAARDVLESPIHRHLTIRT